MSPGCSRFEALQTLLAGTVTVTAIVISEATAVAMTAQQVAQIAVPVTVQINDSADGGGSGVIIARAGNTYTVLTVNHVVKRPDLTYTIRTHTGKTYPVKWVQGLQPSENGPDLAVVTFVSPEKYPLATLGNSEQAVLGTDVYVSGYPALEGRLGAERDYEFSPGIVTSRPSRALQGYTLRYNAVTVSGMSGSPVFDASGRLVGIHGEGESDDSVQTEPVTFIKTGFNSAIPINTFVALRSKIRHIGSQVRVNHTAAGNDQVSAKQSGTPVAPERRTAFAPQIVSTVFRCVHYNEGFATIAERGERTTPPVITWNATLGQYNPQERCNLVSQRLTQIVAQNGGKLSNLQLMAGPMNNQVVICVVNKVQPACNSDNMLFTLRPKNARSPDKVLARLNNFSLSRGPIAESSGLNYLPLKVLNRFLGPEDKTNRTSSPNAMPKPLQDNDI